MIIILDDSKERLSKFKAKIECETALNSQDAISLLEKHDKIEELYLDHDLGSDDTGMKVVEWLVINKKNIKEIIIHSLNHSAARLMKDKLVAAGYSTIIIPFYLLV